eukprot:4151051-Pleurochrysis_carterae.AAC.3
MESIWLRRVGSLCFFPKLDAGSCAFRAGCRFFWSSNFDVVAQEDPSSHEVRYELAQSLMASDETERAVDELLTILKKEKTWNDGAARKLLLQIFDSLGFSHEITKKGRRRLANIMLI